MTFFVFADVINWALLALALGAATTFSVLAFVRPRRLFFWLAAGSLALALIAAATAQGPAPFGLSLLAAAAAIAIATFGGSPAAGIALDLAMGGSVAPGLHGGILVASRVDPEAPKTIVPEKREVLRGGLTIGVLERLATAGAIVAGYPEALAIVVAVKGVGRFTELDAAEARERFIIGTFASLIWAAAAGLVAHLVLR